MLDVETVCSAAMQRYYWSTRLDVDEMSAEMGLHLIYYRAGKQVAAEFDEWHANAFALQLSRNNAACMNAGIERKEIFKLVSKCGRNGRAGSVQREVCKQLHRLKFLKAVVLNFLRGRLVRWQLASLLAHATSRAARNLKVISLKCKAAAASAYLRTLLNGWCTARRFKNTSKSGGWGVCLFGCARGDDSIEHYSRCKVLVDFLAAASLADSCRTSIDSFLLLRGRVSESMIVRHACHPYAF